MGSGVDVGQQCVAESAPTKTKEASLRLDPDPSPQQQAGNQAMQSLFAGGGTAPAGVCRQEQIPEHPLAEYYNLFLALPPSDVRDLENAARRREHLRRGLTYQGPPGFFIAQGPLPSFLPPESGFLPRELMLAQFMPLLLDAARTHSNPAALVREIARNEAARNYTERLPHGLVSVELLDHDGLVKDEPSTLRFSVGVTPVKDVNGLIPLSSLDPLSPRKLELEVMVCTHNAEQLRDLALLQAQTEAGLKDALPVAIQMEMEPQRFALKEVVQLTAAVKDFRRRIRTLSDVLTGPNADQRPLLAALDQQSAMLEVHANGAQTVALRFAHETAPEDTAGEVYSEHEDERKNDLSEDWESGGLGYGKMIFHGLDLGATEIFHGIGTAATGGYMHLEAKNADAYRRGDISYESYSTNVYWNMGKSLVVAAVTAVTAGFGGEFAVGLVGLETGGTATAAYATTYGMGAGFTGGFTGAVTSDTFSLLASHASSDPGVQAMQRSDIVGPTGWLSSASMGGSIGGLVSFGVSQMPVGPRSVPTPNTLLTPRAPVAGFEAYDFAIVSANDLDLQPVMSEGDAAPLAIAPDFGPPRISAIWESPTSRFGEAEYLASGAPSARPVLYAELGGKVVPVDAPPADMTVLPDGEILAGKPPSDPPILFGAGGERIYTTGQTMPGTQILAPSGETAVSVPPRIYLDPEFVPREAGRPGLFQAGGNWNIRSFVSGQQMRACYALEEQTRAYFSRSSGGGGANRTALPSPETFTGRSQAQSSIVTDFTNTARSVYAEAKVRDFGHPRFGPSNTLDLAGSVQRMYRAAGIDAQLIGTPTNPDYYVVSARPIPLATQRIVIRETVTWLRQQGVTSHAIYDFLDHLKFVQMRLK
jgi:hypothetical protein